MMRRYSSRIGNTRSSWRLRATPPQVHRSRAVRANSLLQSDRTPHIACLEPEDDTHIVIVQ